MLRRVRPLGRAQLQPPRPLDAELYRGAGEGAGKEGDSAGEYAALPGWCEQRLFTPLAVNRCRASMLAVGAEGVGWWEGREGKRMCPRLAAGERVLRVRCVADSLHDVLRWGDVCMRRLSRRLSRRQTCKPRPWPLL